MSRVFVLHQNQMINIRATFLLHLTPEIFTFAKK